jgi:two-component system sensor histidine kinase YesM
MTLQPIIENAYLHAYEGIGDGVITVALKEESGTLRIEVTDDGSGIEDHTLARLQESLGCAEGPVGGFGLWNVNRRLKTCYGEPFGLLIDSEFGEFTRVTVTVPLDLPDKGGEEFDCTSS